MARTTFMVVAALALLMLVGIFAIPVWANWPLSWFGGLVLLGMTIAALLLIYRALIRFRGEHIGRTPQ